MEITRALSIVDAQIIMVKRIMAMASRYLPPPAAAAAPPAATAATSSVQEEAQTQPIINQPSYQLLMNLSQAQDSVLAEETQQPQQQPTGTLLQVIMFHIVY
jgi:hypothetical protein